MDEDRIIVGPQNLSSTDERDPDLSPGAAGGLQALAKRITISRDQEDEPMTNARLVVGLTVVLAIALIAPCGATVTTIVHYRLGDDDPGAAAGALGANPTIDAMGVLNLSRSGSPTYVTSPFGLGMHFAGNSSSQDGYSAVANPTTVTDNFGIEAWVRLDSTSNAVIAYNGSTSTSGWGLLVANGYLAGLFGGNIEWGGSAAIPVGSWTYVALVRSGGVATLYLNGVPGSTTATAPNVPTAVAAAAGFVIGSDITHAEYVQGAIDEVRVFTFAPGAFQVTDLNDHIPSIPALSILGLAALALLVLLGGAALLLRG